MTVLAGYLITSPDAPTNALHWSADLDTLGVDYWPPHASVIDAPGANAYIDNLLVEQQEHAIGGFLSTSFSADYYHRVHIRPNPLALGNLVSEQVREVEVWNAHFSSQLLADVSAVDADGITLDAPYPAPTTFGPIESRLYEVSISTSGPPVIDASYTFDFPSEDPVLEITGTRVIVFPFRPNWRQPVTERLEWLTDVMEADDATEQRAALRSIPRRYFDYLATLSGADRQRFDVMLWDWQARVFALPVWTDSSLLGSAIAAGSVVISIDTDYRDYHADGLLVLLTDTATLEAAEIQSVDADSVTLKRPLVGDWPKGTRVMPARLARLQDQQSMTHHTATLAEMLLQFSCEDNDALAGAEYSAATYLGYPVLEESPNWRDDISAEYQRKLQTLDNATGVRTVDDVSGRPVSMQDYLWTRSGRPAIHALRQWLHSRAGRLTPIWVPTYQSDITLVADVGQAATVLQVTNIGYARHIQQAIGRRDICIRLRDGTRLYRRINDSLEVDAATEQLSIDSALGVDVAVGDVVMISFLQLHRLAADAVEMVWHTSEALECRHYLRGMTDDV